MGKLYDPAPTAMDFGRDLLADYTLVVADPWKLCESDLIKIACPALRRALAAEAEVAALKSQLAAAYDRVAAQAELLSRRAEAQKTPAGSALYESLPAGVNAGQQAQSSVAPPPS